MAEIHRTTLVPGKLDLLTAWLTEQPWYAGTGAPSLARAGGYRLDDPAGEVGIEVVLVTDTADDTEDGVTYHVPLAYRGAPREDAGESLVGTSEHGVLGRRWIYDGARDPVVVAQLLALVSGRAHAQHQDRSATLDPSVVGRWDGRGSLEPGDAPVPASGPAATAVPVRSVVEASPPVVEQLTLEVLRVLHTGEDPAGADRQDVRGHVEAGWTQPDGSAARGQVVVVRRLP